MLFLFFLYFQSFLQDVRHNLWDFDQDEDEVAVANYGSKIQEYIPQSKVCGLRKCFFDTSQRVFEKGFQQSGGCGLRNDFQIHLRALFVLFCYYFVIFSIMRCSILSLYNLFVLIRIV